MCVLYRTLISSELTKASCVTLSGRAQYRSEAQDIVSGTRRHSGSSCRYWRQREPARPFKKDYIVDSATRYPIRHLVGTRLMQQTVLDYLTVHPDHQQRGIGSMLLRSGLAVANESHLKVLVNARTQGIELYQRSDFRKVAEAVQDRPQYGWTEPQITAVLLRELS